MATFREQAFVPALLFVGLVVSVVSSLGAPLVPEIAQNLHTSVSSAQWALTVTVVVAAVASPLVGRMGDGRHRKRVIMFCLTAVVVGCAMAAVATSLPVLLCGRALQGLGLALMPLTMAAAREHLSAVRARRAIANISVVGAAGVGLGYPVTGLIADHLDVAAAYWFGMVVSVVALVIAGIVIPHPEDPAAQRHLDVLGAAISGAGLTAVLVALDRGSDWGWTSTRTPALLLIGIGLLIVWVWHELRTREPLVDLRVARHRSVVTANVTGFCIGMTMYLLMVEITQFAQLADGGFGETVFVAGLTLVPLSAMSAISSYSLPWLERHVGARPIIPAGAIAVAGASMLFAVAGDHLWQLFVVTGLLGIGVGYTFGAMPMLIVGSVPRHETGSAIGFYQVSRFVGCAVGSGVAITLLRAFGEHGHPTPAAYHATAFVAAALGLASALLAWTLPGRSEPADGPVGERRGAEGLVGNSGLMHLECRELGHW